MCRTLTGDMLPGVLIPVDNSLLTCTDIPCDGLICKQESKGGSAFTFVRDLMSFGCHARWSKRVECHPSATV